MLPAIHPHYHFPLSVLITYPSVQRLPPLPKIQSSSQCHPFLVKNNNTFYSKIAIYINKIANKWNTSLKLIEYELN